MDDEPVLVGTIPQEYFGIETWQGGRHTVILGPRRPWWRRGRIYAARCRLAYWWAWLRDPAWREQHRRLFRD